MPTNPPAKGGYGGQEETSEVRRLRRTTHGGGTLDARVYIAEERAAAAEEIATAGLKQFAELSGKVDRLTTSIESLTEALRGPGHRIEDGLAWKVTELYNIKKTVVKIVIAVLTAGLIGAGTWIALLYKGH